MTDASRLLVRHTCDADIPQIVALQKRVYPHMPAWNAGKLETQLSVFPAGQIVAEYEGEIVGCASSLVVLWDEWCEEHTWKEITASGTFFTHTPSGRTLYGAEVCVDPTRQGMGIGHQLYEGRRRLCREMNLRRIIACGRLPGYHRYQHAMTPEFYAKKVVWGDIHDQVLSFQLHEGFQFCGVIDDYIPEDWESCGKASLIVWINPDHDPSRPTELAKEVLP